MAAKRNLKTIGAKYAHKRAELKKSFYSLKKQGFADGNYKDTIEYKRLIRAEKSAIYRYKNADAIRERKKQRLNFAGKGALKTIKAVNSMPAYKAFSGGKNSAYFKILSLLLQGRVFFGYIEVIKSEDGFPGELRVNNPYLSVAGYYKKVRQIIDLLQNEHNVKEYLFLTTIVTIIYTYNDEKVVVTHIFDFSNT